MAQRVLVLYFRPGCPACEHFKPIFVAWAKTRPTVRTRLVNTNTAPAAVLRNIEYVPSLGIAAANGRTELVKTFSQSARGLDAVVRKYRL